MLNPYRNYSNRSTHALVIAYIALLIELIRIAYSIL
jgi:hypothetical protein